MRSLPVKVKVKGKDGSPFYFYQANFIFTRQRLSLNQSKKKHYVMKNQNIAIMKTQDLSQIMKMAWRFFKITGQAFGECLRKAWANYKLVQRMHSGIVKFYFQKVDGSIREAWGTLCEKLMPPTKSDDHRKKNDTVQVYFDTEAQEFRCFKKLNLI